MDGQAYGPLFQRALRQFSPDVFHHPVWVRFADSLASLSGDQIQQLAKATHQVQSQGDWASACQLLILCAVQQSRLGDYQGALSSIAGAERLAERYHLNQMVIWAIWGACALCAQKGDFRPAVEHLRHLQAVLETSGDWILSDLVQLIQQSLSRLAESGDQAEPSSRPNLTDPLLRTAIEGLLQWGQIQRGLEVETTWKQNPGGLDLPGEMSGPKSSGLREWRNFLGNVWRLLRGDLKVTWVKNGGGTMAPPGTPPKALRDPDIVDSPTRPVQTPPAVSPPPPQRFIESATGTLFIKAPNLPREKPAQTAELPKSQPLPAAVNKEKPVLVIYCLGPFRVYQQDQLVTDWQSQKGLSILKYLSAHPGKPVAKDILMDLFWSDAECEIARRNLHQAIYALRQTLRREQPGIPYIQFENDCYLLNPDLEIWLDFTEFERQAQAGRKLESAGKTVEAMEVFGIAEGLYQGDFLEEDLYEDWPRQPRMYFRTMYLNLLDRLTEYYVQRREFTPAIGLCQKVLALDNCNEQAYRWLIQCYLEQGQRQLAMREYQTCLQTLKEELNLAPSAETQAMYRQIVG